MLGVGGGQWIVSTDFQLFHDRKKGEELLPQCSDIVDEMPRNCSSSARDT